MNLIRVMPAKGRKCGRPPHNMFLLQTGPRARRTIHATAQRQRVIGPKRSPPGRSRFAQSLSRPAAEAQMPVPRNGGFREPKPAVRVYDSSGPYTDEGAKIDIDKGLTDARAGWLERAASAPRRAGR